jgi:predicted signal transduction protein with EAL and GGDEF domain
LGGDEFAVLVEDVESHDQVISLAERIMTVLRRPVMVGPQKMSTSASVGITFGITESTSEQLLRNADLAMYLAKSQGKDRYEEFQDQMHAAVVARLELESDLRKAVANEEFVVHYQPIVNVYSGEIVGVESLVRWQHPTNGLLAPAEFIPFAEEIGLIDEIDDFVLRQACQQVRQWQDEGCAHADFLVSVNLSAREIIDPEVHLRVATALGESGLDARNLILEITESAVMRDVDAAVRNLHLLKQLGASIAIDDFGTGYSSFSHLELMPIDILKVDRSFVANVARDDLQPNLSSAIVQLAQTLGLTTIAEGVEHADQADRLAQIGCTLAQGYHLGRPIDAVGTESILRAQTQLQSWTRTS